MVSIPFLRRGAPGGSMEMPSVPAPRPEVAVSGAISPLEARKQAGALFAAAGREAASAGDTDAGLAALVQAPRVETASNLVGVEPRGPGRWMGGPRSDVDSAAIGDMGIASAEHAQEEGKTGNEVVAPTQSPIAKPVENVSAPLVDSNPAQTVEVAAVPPLNLEKPTGSSAGEFVETPTAVSTTAAPVETVTPQQNVVAAVPEAPVPTASVEQPKKTIEQILNKTDEQYAAMDPKARAEYLTQALDLYLENPSAIRLSDEDFAQLAEKMAGKGEVQQDETIKYAINSALRLVDGKNPEMMKNLFSAMGQHPELKFLMVKTADKMNVKISLENKKHLIKASEVGKGSLLMLLMIVLNLSKEMVMGSFSDQRR